MCVTFKQTHAALCNKAVVFIMHLGQYSIIARMNGSDTE